MCRKNQLLGCMLAAFGIGMLVGCFFESGFFCGFLGLSLAIAGLALSHRK